MVAVRDKVAALVKVVSVKWWKKPERVIIQPLIAT